MDSERSRRDLGPRLGRPAPAGVPGKCTTTVGAIQKYPLAAGGRSTGWHESNDTSAVRAGLRATPQLPKGYHMSIIPLQPQTKQRHWRRFVKSVGTYVF
jgi:hypothetical protein